MSEHNPQIETPVTETTTPVTETPATPPTSETSAPAATPAAEFTPLTVDDITIPEGYEVNADQMTPFLEIMNDQSLTPAQRGSALVALYGKSLEAASEASSTQWADTMTKWQDQTRADPTIGGANLDATMGRVNGLVREFAPDGNVAELDKVFLQTGVGNHPLMIKFLNNIASVLAEGKPATGAPSGGNAIPLADRMYPTTAQGKA